ncbi:hypothetical protein ACWCQQ_26375 [Streptomyces sp. NPDC002143]
MEDLLVGGPLRDGAEPLADRWAPKAELNRPFSVLVMANAHEPVSIAR